MKLGNAAKKILPLAALDTDDNSMRVVRGQWTGLNSNEGFDTTLPAKTHDECRHTTCN